MEPLIKPGIEVKISEDVQGHQLLDGFEGRYGRVSHLVAGEDRNSENPIWVVAVARSNYERKLMFSNATDSIDEVTCSWMPVPQNCLVLNEDDDATGIGIKKRRLDLESTKHLSHIPAITKQTLEDFRIRQHESAAETRSVPSVCVIVCFRDLHVQQNRGEHLAKFVPHMTQFFTKAQTLGKCDRYRYAKAMSAF